MEGGRGFHEKLEFRQIVLAHIKRILELSSHQLRDTTYVISTGNQSDKKYQEDTRYSYIQSIENLAYVLSPYFDEKIQKVYDPCIKVMDAFGYEVKKLLHKEYEEMIKESKKQNPVNDYIIEMKLRHSKKLFIALNSLLFRNNYLKSNIYGEEVDEVVVDEDDFSAPAEESTDETESTD